ncbi:hypothetical protein NVV95_17655 [Herbiconiux sp. CPCC 205716]|uniref:Uncharacterized protein n=1 Tax=Herbiconiux gentiana TaxID=2970912 RepID=A0ABT2GJT8_9MICO|nr:hypothetical protein [Herbiconiux gentiana]MCS5716376.1 hypothetical protein [Herbiconiux gentiana]
MSDEMRDWVAEHEREHPEAPDEREAEEVSPAQGELAAELRSIRAVGEDRR